MLTPEQEKWVAHLSDTDTIVIIPYDSNSEKKFEKLRATIREQLGEAVQVEHHGASSLQISGQDEIDVYIPVLATDFARLIPLLTKLFGPPKSQYPRERVRFQTRVDDKKIDVFLINEKSSSWLNSLLFERYLKTHPEALETYRKLKENGNGINVREYYRRKIEFINEVVARAKS